MKRIFTILACLLCVLVVNAQDIIVRKPSKKQPTTQTSTAAKKQSTTTKPAKKTSATTSSTNSNRQRILQELADNMVYVQGGTFTMGATSEQESDFIAEKPVHSVTLSSYYIGKTEVTQELWQAVMGSNPSKFKGDRKPVEQVSWDDCQTFISKLNTLTGKNYRLPTEAEWEFAARGGIKSKGYKYSGSNIISDVAWYKDNSGETTHEVGTKSPNELGLYDMSGNVSVWCSDWFNRYSSSPSNNPTGPDSGIFRVYRGGRWGDVAIGCHLSNRHFDSPDYCSYELGLRLCLSE